MYSIKKNQDALLNETGSKWSFLFADGKIINVGDGVKEDGIWYSNAGFRGYPVSRIWQSRTTVDTISAKHWIPDPDWTEWCAQRSASMVGYF